MSRTLVNVPTPDILDNPAAMLRLRATVTKSTALMSIQHHHANMQREIPARDAYLTRATRRHCADALAPVRARITLSKRIAANQSDRAETGSEKLDLALSSRAAVR